MELKNKIYNVYKYDENYIKNIMVTRMKYEYHIERYKKNIWKFRYRENENN
jgi:hypothetical protein